MALLFFPFPAFSCELEQARGEHEGRDMPEGSSTPPPPLPPSRVLTISVVYEHNVYVAVYAQILQSEKEETIKKNI